MDKLDMVIKALDDLKQDVKEVDKKVDDGFKTLNGRVRKTEQDIFKIKTVWTVMIGAVAAAYHAIFG